VPKACPGATCSDQPAWAIGRYMLGLAYYAYNTGLGQGELKFLKFFIVNLGVENRIEYAASSIKQQQMTNDQ